MTRVTKILIHGKTYTLQVEYEKINDKTVKYSVFRSRLKTYELKLQQRSVTYRDKSIFSKVATYNQNQWMKIIGIGRAKVFTYCGSKFKKYPGLTFISMPFFLDVVGKLNNHKLVQSRLKQGFDIDIAIELPICSIVNGFGQVYLLTNLATNRRYVGITTIGIKQRFEQHVAKSNHDEKMSKIHRELKEFGRENFEITVLANKVSAEILPELEIRYIREYRTLWPGGLNSTLGGELNQRRGIACKVGDLLFRSISEASRYVESATKGRVKQYVAESRLRQGRELPSESRQRSFNKEAGTIFFRKHLGLKRKELLCIDWLNFDNFKHDITQMGYQIESILDNQLILFRPDKTRPYSKTNCVFISRAKERARSTGNEYDVFGKTYSGLAEVARAHNIKETTLRNRVKNMKLPIELAVNFKL